MIQSIRLRRGSKGAARLKKVTNHRISRTAAKFLRSLLIVSFSSTLLLEVKYVVLVSALQDGHQT